MAAKFASAWYRVTEIGYRKPPHPDAVSSAPSVAAVHIPMAAHPTKPPAVWPDLLACHA